MALRVCGFERWGVVQRLSGRYSCSRSRKVGSGWAFLRFYGPKPPDGKGHWKLVGNALSSSVLIMMQGLRKANLHLLFLSLFCPEVIYFVEIFLSSSLVQGESTMHIWIDPGPILFF